MMGFQYVYSPCFDDPESRASLMKEAESLVLGPLPPGPKPLTAKKEQSLFRHMNFLHHIGRHAQARLVRNRIWLHAEDLVPAFFRRYRGRTEEEIIAACAEAEFCLVDCIARFDFERGRRFSTYLFQSLRNHSAHSWMCKQTRFETDCRMAVSVDSLAGGSDPADIAAVAEDRERIRGAMKRLNANERFVINHRYIGSSLTLQEIGNQLHLTRERVRQIERKALAKLRGFWGCGI